MRTSRAIPVPVGRDGVRGDADGPGVHGVDRERIRGGDDFRDESAVRGRRDASHARLVRGPVGGVRVEPDPARDVGDDARDEERLADNEVHLLLAIGVRVS